ncbi:FtsK/SpoIIIE domain-containing protein [Desulforhopalus singaporensis]|uniref:FtsK/SpoIIIE family protein n=1 Tax=Desulforhopalus singaporensis TaxID=91360 RepID=A0A1H0U5E1_9BACT|nr:FtsK/SpoIIIE domain-containing protein [Desulforhopalus singaporensis]SDP61379.1 FtsK/SpoIIIE family protein [Desulforhopalus singaporensis]
MISEIIGRLIALRSLQNFSKEDRKQIILVEGFSTEEVVSAIKSLNELHEVDGRDPMKGPLISVIPSREPSRLLEQSIENDLILDSNTKPTTFRNSDDSNKYLLFVLGEQSDRQSFGQIDSIKDRDLLYLHENFGLKNLIKISWNICNPGNSLPDTLVSSINLVVQNLHEKVVPLSVRGIASFVNSTVKSLSGKQLVAEKDALKAALKNLPELDLFQDEEGAEELISIIPNRLKKNYYAAAFLKQNNQEVDREKIAQKTKNHAFVNVNTGTEYTTIENQAWRKLCHDYCVLEEKTLLKKIPWTIFSQVLENKKALKLGAQIRTEILDSRDPEAVDIFDSLDIEDGLDRNRSAAARMFLENEPFEGSGFALQDLIEEKTLKRVVRLASRASIVDKFLQWFLEEVYQLPLGGDNNYKLFLKLGNTIGDELPKTVKLFSFLHKDLLLSLVEESPDECKLEIQPELTDNFEFSVEKLREWVNKIEVSEEKIDELWPSLPLVLEIQKESNTEEYVVEDIKYVNWAPKGIKALIFWLIYISTEEYHSVVTMSIPGRDSFEEFFAKYAEAASDFIVDYKLDEKSLFGASRNWYELRKSFILETRELGVSSSLCIDFFKRWQDESLALAVKEFELQGTSVAEFDVFMQFDAIKKDDAVCLLPLHPFRARWIGAYLQLMEKTILLAMNSDLKLSGQNEEYFFNYLNDLSPHQHPPYYIGKDEKFFKSVEEYGWVEEYRLISKQGAPKEDWLSLVDEEAIEAMTLECHRYLEFHPYKKSGLDILILQYGKSNFIERFIIKLFKKYKNSGLLNVRLHVCAPEEVLKGTEFLGPDCYKLLDAHDEYQLFPRVELNVYPWKEQNDLPEEVKLLKTDIALVPNIFEKNLHIYPKIFSEESFEDRSFESYEPTISRPVRMVPSQRGAVNVQIDLLPEYDDQALFQWSSLSVMFKLSMALSNSKDDIEHFRLRVEVKKSEELFSILHSLSLWVITLDSYISRQHIESLPEKPDVITFRDNIGKNGLYNLIISSKMGEHFVIPRLEKKIKDIFAGKIIGKDVSTLSKQIYDESCLLAPGVVLKSLGGGWTLNELLGLICSKRYAEENLSGSGKQKIILHAWIALDQQLKWFGGATQQKRADLLWIKICQPEDDAQKITLELTVVESKFGDKNLIEKGLFQVNNTLKLIQQVFASKEEQNYDGRIWRENLLQAIENSPSLTIDGSMGARRLPGEIRELISLGHFDVVKSKPLVFCHSVNEEEDSISDLGTEKVITTSFETIVKSLCNESSKEKSYATVGNTSLCIDNGSVSHPPADQNIFTKNKGESTEPERTNLSEKTAGYDRIPIEYRKEVYQRILDKFHNLNINMLDPGSESEWFLEGPAFMRMLLKPASSTKLKSIRNADEELKIALELPEAEKIRIFSDTGKIWLEAPKKYEYRVPVTLNHILENFKKDEESFSLPFGVDISGKLQCITFSSSSSPHLLIGGTTGSGKSVTLETILNSAIQLYSSEELVIKLIDPKGNELIDFEDYEHVPDDVKSEPEDAIELLEECVSEMEIRYKKFRAQKTLTGKAAKNISDFNKKSPELMPRWIVVLDEYADLVADNDDKKAIEKLVKRLCAKARAAGIHVIIATQKPLAEIVSSTIKANLPATIALKVKTVTDSRVILDSDGAEALIGAGDALYKDGAGRTIRVQCAMSS